MAESERDAGGLAVQSHDEAAGWAVALATLTSLVADERYDEADDFVRARLGEPDPIRIVRLDTRVDGDLSTRLMALDGVVPVGYVELIWNPRWLAIADLFVEEPRRRQGIGRRLFAAAQAVARRGPSFPLYLWVDPENWASAWYERMGWTRTRIDEETGYAWYRAPAAAGAFHG